MSSNFAPPPLPAIPRWPSLKVPLIIGGAILLIVETLIFIYMEGLLGQQFFVWFALGATALFVFVFYSGDMSEKTLARNKAYVLANRQLVENCTVDKTEMYLFCMVSLRGFEYQLEIERGEGCLGLREELLGIKHRLSL